MFGFGATGKDQKQEVEKLQKDLITKKKEVEALQNMVSNLNKQLESRNRELEDFRLAYTSGKAPPTSSNPTAPPTNSNALRKETDHGTQSKLDEALREIEDLTDRIGVLEGANQELRNAHSELVKENQKIQEHMDEWLNGDDSDEFTATTTEPIAPPVGHRESRRGSVLQRVKEQLNAEFDEERAEMQQVKQQNEVLQREVADLRRRCETQGRELGEIRRKHDDTSGHLENHKRVSAQIEEKNEELQALLQSEQGRNAHLQQTAMGQPGSGGESLAAEMGMGGGSPQDEDEDADHDHVSVFNRLAKSVHGQIAEIEDAKQRQTQELRKIGGRLTRETSTLRMQNKHLKEELTAEAPFLEDMIARLGKFTPSNKKHMGRLDSLAF